MFRSTILKCLVALFFCVSGIGIAAEAQNYSYVYIQGDKQTPFYVKYEGEMLPRFGKNYYIISELNPGPANIEVLFQQNVYAPEKFTINVPENGFRGFLLMKKGPSFSLYDIHQHFYLPSGNTLAEDVAPAGEMVAMVNQAEVENTVPEPVKETPKPATKTTKPVKTTTPKPKPTGAGIAVGATTAAAATTKAGNGEPQFIDNIELKGNTNTNNTVPAGAVQKNKPAIMNSDCPKAISNDSFEDILGKANNKQSTARLKYLLDRMDNCFTTNQVRILTKTLETDAERYTLLKRAYARVTDQSVFPTLEKLLSGEEWKGYFRELVKQ